MGVIMKVVSSGGGKGAAGITRYIAERDRDPEKEGKEPRKLFSRSERDLSYRQAATVLSAKVQEPDKEQFIHFVVSFRSSDFERLGENNQERKEAVLEITREAMIEVEKDLDAKEMDWIAGIHLDKDNPHVHIAISKNMLDRTTGLPKRVNTIPMALRGQPDRNEQQPERAPETEQSKDNKLSTIVGFHTTVPGRAPGKFDFIQRSDGTYLALDKPFEMTGGVVTRKAVDVDLTKLFDPNGLLPGTDVARSRDDWDNRLEPHLRAELENVDFARDGRRGRAEAMTRALESLGYVGEVGWIDGPEGQNRELIIFDRSAVREADPEHRNVQDKTQDAGRTENAPKKIAEHFQKALESRAEPITHIVFNLAETKTAFRRELFVAKDQEPLPEHILVGRWIMLEVDPTTPTDEARNQRRQVLKHNVHNLDRESRIKGEKFVAAYIPPDELDAALASGQIRALKSDQTQHKPFNKPEHEQEQEETREPVLKERETLGRELAAKLRVVHLGRQLEMAVQQGETRAYEIFDADLLVARKSSQRDLQQRAQARSSRLANESEPDNAQERAQARKSHYEVEMQGNEPAVNSIEKDHAEAVSRLEGLLDKALTRHDRLLAHASRIERAYQAEGTSMPTPLINRATLDQLQEQAISRKDTPCVKQLEQLRLNLAKEFGGEVRDEQSSQRLEAQAILARQDSLVSGKRIEDFNKSSHLRKFEINGEKLSLSDVDREIRFKESEAKFQERRAEFYSDRLSWKGAFNNPFSLQSLDPIRRIERALTTNPLKGFGQLPFGPTLNPLRRAEYHREMEASQQAAQKAQERLDELQPTRDEVVKRIEGQRAELHGQHAQNQELSATLEEAREINLTERLARDLSQPEPRFTPWELRRLETNASLLRDGQALKDYELRVTEFSRSLDKEIKIDPARMAARAFAREQVAEVMAEEASARLENFMEHRATSPVQYMDKDGVLRTGSLREVEPRNWIDKLNQTLFDSPADAFKRDAIESAVELTGQTLLTDRDTATQYLEATREIAGGYRELLHSIQPQAGLPQPEYTRQELSTIERYSVQLTDVTRREEFREMVQNAIEGGRVGNHPIGNDYPGSTDIQQDHEPEMSWKANLERDEANPLSNAPGHQEPGRGPDISGAAAAPEVAAPEIALEIPIIPI